MNNENSTSFKILLIGDENVGKTSLSYRFCEGKEPLRLSSTIGVDIRQHIISIENESITLRLWDFSSKQIENKNRNHYFNNVNAIIFVYDVSNPKSFMYLRTWIENNIKNFYDVLKIMVGNKCDLDNLISTSEAQQFADKFNMPLFETSSKLDSENDNINSIFLTVVYKLKSNKLLITNSSETKFMTNSVTQDSKCYIQ